MFLITGPHTSPVPGCFEAGRAAMAEALGWSLEAFDKAFAEAFGKGMVKADFKARFVWLPNAIRHNRPESPNVVKSWGHEFDLLPECALKAEAYHAIESVICGMGEAFAKAFREAFAKPSVKPSAKASPNQEQEQEQEKTEKKPASPAVDHDTTIWKLGVSLLTKAGSSESAARTFLGQYAKGGKAPKLAEVIARMSLHPVAEPKSYITAAMRESGDGIGTYSAAELAP